MPDEQRTPQLVADPNDVACLRAHRMRQRDRRTSGVDASLNADNPELAGQPSDRSPWRK
jgi:hypothetical protein